MRIKLLKKFLLCIILFSLLTTFFVTSSFATDDEEFSIDSPAGILMDLSTVKVLY